jgi:O-antigen ligase
MSTYFTVAASALASMGFFGACLLRSNSRWYLAILIAAILMCIICLCSSEYHLSPVNSTIDILLCYSALIGLSAMTADLGSFCRRLMIFSFIIPVVIVLAETAKNGGIEAWKIGGLGMSPNYMAAHINMTLPLLVAYAAQAQGMARRCLWATVLLGAFAVICIGSRNGIGTLAIMLVMFCLFNNKRTAVFTCIILALILLCSDELMQNPYINHLLARFRLVGFEAKTSRTVIWSISAQYIQASPWIGIGPGGSERVLRVIDINHAHNNVIQIALESGIPVALLYTVIISLLLLIPARGLFRTRRAFLAGLPVIAYFMVSLTDNTIHHPETTLLLIACVHEARRVMLVSRPGLHDWRLDTTSDSPQLSSSQSNHRLRVKKGFSTAERGRAIG